MKKESIVEFDKNVVWFEVWKQGKKGKIILRYIKTNASTHA